jgi:hypothetical protein
VSAITERDPSTPRPNNKNQYTNVRNSDCFARNAVISLMRLPMPQRTRSLIRWSAWLCLSLMLWTAAVESTHTHPSQSDGTTCSICVAAHSTCPTASTVHAAPVFATIDHLQEKDVLAKPRLDVANLGNRGPPIV